MKLKIICSLILLIFIFWPQKYSSGEADTNVLETRITYQKVKYDVLKYEVDKKIELVEKRLDSIKNKK